MPTSSRPAWQQQLPALAGCAALLWLGFLVYGATGHDDAHINFWSAWTLLEHGELLNYNGERVEQTTSLLLVLLTAVLHLLSHANLVTCGYMVDIFASLGCCWLVLKLARQQCTGIIAWPTLLLLSSPSFMLWTFGGMGATLAAVVVLATTTVWSRWITVLSIQIIHIIELCIVTAALTLVRPEMPLVAMATAASITLFYWHDSQNRYRSAQLLLISTLAAIILFGWQKLYFDSWLPMPVVAKQSGDLFEKLRNGYFYLLLNGAVNPTVFFVLVAMPLFWWRQYKQGKHHLPATTPLTVLTNFLLVYTGFIWTAGGDWMQAGRFLVPILPAVTLLLPAMLGTLKQRWLIHITLGALCIFQINMQYQSVEKISKGIPIWVRYHLAPQHQRYSIFEQLNQEHLRDMSAIDHLADIISSLQKKLGRPVVLMSGQAGMVFYYTAKRFGHDVIFRDLHGLVEGNLTTCPAIKTIPRSQQGLFWSYTEFFAALPALQKNCRIATPDIIYDLNNMSRTTVQQLEAAGYALLHQENGFPIENTTDLPYNRLYAPDLIFVRNDLMPLLDSPEKRTINYRDLPLQSRWPLTTQ